MQQSNAALTLRLWWENPAANDACASAKSFPGQYYDAETNLHYNYFRDYDPSLGRYIESDPLGLIIDFSSDQRNDIGQTKLLIQELDLPSQPNHLYAYTENNPIRFIDLLGLASSCVTNCTSLHATCKITTDLISTVGSLVCVATFPKLAIPCAIGGAGIGAISNFLCDEANESCLKDCDCQ